MALEHVQFVPRPLAQSVFAEHHYLKRLPTGWLRCYTAGGVWFAFSRPANKNLEQFLFAREVGLVELARLWAPDGHKPNALTRQLRFALEALRRDVPTCDAVVSFADPNFGHEGYVYQAASWLYTGTSTETRAYQTIGGRTVARRAFHSGSRSTAITLPTRRVRAKYRYVRPLSYFAKRALKVEVLPYPKRAVEGSGEIRDASGIEGLGQFQHAAPTNEDSR